jgi:sterol-4alpha-carboxylate 3-dehydrogenase (decarboxylating)
MFHIFERGQTHFQIGDNNNLFDWTYVENVAYAHVLAADKLTLELLSPPKPELENVTKDWEIPPPNEWGSLLTDEEVEMISTPLPPLENLSTSSYRVPTSDARPLGPFVTPPKGAEEITRRWNEPSTEYTKRPVTRTKYDQMSNWQLGKDKVRRNVQYQEALEKAEAEGTEPPSASAYQSTSTLSVSGQAFFITNCEPLYFWDFPRILHHHFDAAFPDKRPLSIRTLQKRTILPTPLGLVAAWGAEWYSWLVGKEPTFTRFRVVYSTVNRWYNVEKARRVLGYEPKVGVEEGVRRMIEWWKEELKKGTHDIVQGS